MCKTGRIELKGLTLYTGGDELNMKTTDKLDKYQFAIARALAGLDGNGKELSKADMEKFSKMSKTEQTALIDKAFKEIGSQYRIAEKVISNEEGTEYSGVYIAKESNPDGTPKKDAAIRAFSFTYSKNGSTVYDADEENAHVLLIYPEK